MLTLIYGFVLSLNLTLLIFSILELGAIFVLYFAIAQGIVLWLLMDYVVEVKTDSLKLLPQSKNKIASLPASKGKGSHPIETINFEPTEQLNFASSNHHNENQDKAYPQKFYFFEKSFDDQNKSQLEMLDQLLIKIPRKTKTLIVTNLYTKSIDSKNLETLLWGLGLESEIICSDIYPGIDLIPHLGTLENCPHVPTSDYFFAKAIEYDQVIFYLVSRELQQIEIIISDKTSNFTAADLQQIRI